MASSGTRVLVVGAGIVGRSVAYFLSRQDIEVVLLDSTKTPSATTRASLGVLTRFNGGTSSYARLFRDGCAFHARLAADLAVEMGVDVGWRPLGSIELYLNPSDEWRLEELLASSRERGCPVDRLDGRALREMEPALAAEVFLTGQETALRGSVTEAGEAQTLALEDYQAGLTDIVTVLESQRRVFDAKRSLIELQNLRLQNRIDLYLALGGEFAQPAKDDE